MSEPTLKQIIQRVNLDPVLVLGTVADCCVTWHHSNLSEFVDAAANLQEKLNSEDTKTSVMEITGEAIVMITLINCLQAEYTFDSETMSGLIPTKKNPDFLRLKREIVAQGLQQQKLDHISGLNRNILQQRFKQYCSV